MTRTQHIRPLKKDTAKSGTPYPVHPYSQALIKRLEGEPLNKGFYLVNALQALAIVAMMSGTVALYSHASVDKQQPVKPTKTEQVTQTVSVPKERTPMSYEEKEKMARNFVFFLIALSAVQAGRSLFKKPHKEVADSFQSTDLKPESNDSQKAFDILKPTSSFFFKWKINRHQFD